MTIQSVGWLDDVENVDTARQTFDPTSPNISFVLMLNVDFFRSFWPVSTKILHARTCIVTKKNQVVTIECFHSRDQ